MVVCEDDVAITEVIKILLEQINMTMYVPSEYKTLPKQIEKIKPACILMDLRIGELSGATFVEQLRGNSKTASIPIILLSANSDATTKAKELNVEECIQKPFDISYFKETVQKYIKK